MLRGLGALAPMSSCLLVIGGLAAAEPSDESPSAEPEGAVSAPPELSATAEGPEEARTAEPPKRAREEILIKGRREAPPGIIAVTPERATPSVPDAVRLLDLVPGGAVNWNGPISGQVQYRGLGGLRVPTRVGNSVVVPGGPNWMDPPLHYAPRPLLDSLEVERGISPVSAGAETIGGSAAARLKTSEFGEDGRARLRFQGEIGGRSADESVDGGGLLSLANDRARFHILGSGERGADYRSGLGKVVPSRYQRAQIGGGGGLRLGQHDLASGYRYHDTTDTGTPALPMDIRFFRTHLWDLDTQGRIGRLELESRVYYTNIDHRMDNFTLRTPTSAPRFVTAEGQSAGFDLVGGLPLPLGKLAFGVDGLFSRHDQDIFDPNNAAFFVVNYNDAMRDRVGGFVEWEAEPLPRIGVRAGLRYTRVETDAGPVDATPAMMLPPPMRLRDAFNSAERARSDDLVDFAVELAWQASDALRLELEGGRKTRAPSHIERYQWIPLEVTAGLADGNNYVGDLDLRPESAWEIGGGFGWSPRWGGEEWWACGLRIAPHAFYKRVDDYIQGTPSEDPDVIAVSTLNGDPTPLEFGNVEAELFGIDADLGIDLPGPLQLDGTLSFVRGRRLDIDDDLYRVAPLRGRITLSWQASRWFAAIEGVLVGAQSAVSVTNEELPTPGYQLLNLYAGWQITDGVQLLLGLDNVTDAPAQDHLAGFNRTPSTTGVALGERLPAPGISGYGRLVLRY